MLQITIKTKVFTQFCCIFWFCGYSKKQNSLSKSKLILQRKSHETISILQTCFVCIAFLLFVCSLLSFYFQPFQLIKNNVFFCETHRHRSVTWLNLRKKHNASKELATQTKSHNEQKAIRRNDFIYHSCCLLCFVELFNNCERIHFTWKGLRLSSR